MTRHTNEMLPVIMIESEEYGTEVRRMFEEETKKEGDCTEDT